MLEIEKLKKLLFEKEEQIAAISKKGKKDESDEIAIDDGYIPIDDMPFREEEDAEHRSPLEESVDEEEEPVKMKKNKKKKKRSKRKREEEKEEKVNKRRRKKNDEPIVRVCKTCGVEKDFIEFKKTGVVRGICYECALKENNERTRARRQNLRLAKAEKEKVRERDEQGDENIVEL